MTGRRFSNRQLLYIVLGVSLFTLFWVTASPSLPQRVETSLVVHSDALDDFSASKDFVCDGPHAVGWRGLSSFYESPEKVISPREGTTCVVRENVTYTYLELYGFDFKAWVHT